MDNGTAHADTHDLLSLLRNTIHGEALRQVGHSGVGGKQNLVALPSEEQDAFFAIVARRGGEDAWGVRPSGREMYIEPDRFVERLFPMVIAAIDDVMAKTRTNRLLAGAPPVSSGPPEKFPFTSAIRARLRFLGGFG